MIKFVLTKKENQPLCKWQGGETRQFFIFPEDKKGATAFDYEFEITSSTMEYPQTDYTIYSGYDRILMIIEGKTRLIHQDGRTADLKKYDYDIFPGEMSTKSEGIATDYEMMIRRGSCGDIKVLDISQGEICEDLKIMDGYEMMFCGFYCCGENSRIVSGAQEFELYHGDHLSVMSSDDIVVSVSGKGGPVINSVIHFNYFSS